MRSASRLGGRDFGSNADRIRAYLDDVANLAAVCPAHHALLVPHGDLVLSGNPNRPDGLALRRIPAEERRRRSPAGMTLAT